MNLAHWAAEHRRSLLFLLTILVIGGVTFSFSLPVGLFPQVNFPRISVAIEAGDRPADQMVIAVTRPVEQAVRSVPGVVSVRSTTSRGSAELSINFAWGEDLVAALLQVESAINQVLPTLPTGTRFAVRRMDPTVFPVAAYSLVSEASSAIELRDIASFELVPVLSAINGVAKVTVIGGEQAEYRVEVDPEKLNALGLSLEDVAGALRATNVLEAIGRLEDHYKLYLLLSDTRLGSLKSIEDTVLRSGERGVIRVGDIAHVIAASAPQWTRVTADGSDAVLLQVYQQPGGNTVQIVKDINSQLKTYRQKLPSDVTIANWYDQSQLITDSASSVRDAIAIGIILAACVLFAFLRSFKIAIAAALIVPAVLATTTLLLHVLNMSFNIMTLGGMAAAVGLIVDDAIVMIEHIVRRLRERSVGLAVTVREAAIEFSPPLAGSSAATIIIFAPLAFLGGVTGAFFKALSMTMASSLVISFFVAWLVVPLLAEHFLSQKDADMEDVGRLFKGIQRHYVALMDRLLKKPVLLLIGVVPLMTLGGIMYGQVGSGFIPQMDEGGFILDYRSPAGTSLTETDRLLRQIEQIISADPAIETYSRRTGVQLGGGLTEANEGDYFIRLKPLPRAPLPEVMDGIRDQIERNVPGIEVEMALLMEDLIGDLTAVPQPVEIKLFSDNVDDLMKAAPDIANRISQIQGIVDAQDGIVLAGDAINIIVDRDKAAIEGIDPATVTAQAGNWSSGIVTTSIQQDVKLVNVRVWVPVSDRNMVTAINKIMLTAKDGHRVPLSRIATVQTQVGQPQIARDNLKRMVAVTARINGRDLGSTIKDVKAILSTDGVLPKGMYYDLGGLYKEQQVAFRGLLAVFCAAFALVFLLLLFLYEEFAAAIAILISPVLAMSAVYTGLWLANIDLNITAMMGMTMIVGIVTEVSIFYFSEYHDLLQRGLSREDAIKQAGHNRLRPIAMTTLAAILALLPLAFALGQGSAMQQPLAVAIISGLIVQMPLVLVVMPIAHYSLQKLSLWRLS